MTANTRMSGARVATVAGLAAGAVGIIVLRVSGTPMPAVPPGLILLIGAAVLVAVTRWRWAPAVGALVAVAEILGVTLSGSLENLVDVEQVGIMAGTWIRSLGIVTALVAGIVATVTHRRTVTAE